MVATPSHLFDQTVAVTRVTDAVTTAGLPTQSWASHLSGVAARVQPMSGFESVRYGREATSRMWRVYVTGGLDILPTDRITFGTHTLRINEVSDPQSHGALLRIIAEEAD